MALSELLVLKMVALFGPTSLPASGSSIPLTGNGEVSVAADGTYLVYGVTENQNRNGQNW
jgi:hypothetical protein